MRPRTWQLLQLLLSWEVPEGFMLLLVPLFKASRELLLLLLQVVLLQKVVGCCSIFRGRLFNVEGSSRIPLHSDICCAIIRFNLCSRNTSGISSCICSTLTLLQGHC